MATQDQTFPRDAELTAVAIAYKNPDVALIADKVLPRKPVGKKAFEWTEYPEHQQFTVPNTRMGETSAFPRIEVKGLRLTSKCEDNGLESLLSADDVSEAPKGIDPRAVATETLTNLILLRREVDVANLVLDATKYPAANKATLAGAAQWSDVASDPIRVIRATLDAMLVRPNCLTLGQPVWSYLSVHPRVVKAATGNDSGEGVCTLARLTELLELAEINVGAARVNTAKEGNAASISSCWGKFALAYYRDRTATPQGGGLTFGFTAEFERRQSGSKVIDAGTRGATAVRTWECTKDLIVAPGVAFLWSAAVA